MLNETIGVVGYKSYMFRNIFKKRISHVAIPTSKAFSCKMCSVNNEIQANKLLHCLYLRLGYYKSLNSIVKIESTQFTWVATFYD